MNREGQGDLIRKEHTGPLPRCPCQMTPSSSETSSVVGLYKARSDCWSPGTGVCLMKSIANRLVADVDVAGYSQVRPQGTGGGCSITQ